MLLAVKKKIFLQNCDYILLVIKYIRANYRGKIGKVRNVDALNITILRPPPPRDTSAEHGTGY